MAEITVADLQKLLGRDHLHISEALKRLSPVVLRDLAASAHIRTVSEGDVIESDGVMGSMIGYVLDGAIGMLKPLPDGRTHIVGLLLPTDLFGRLTAGVGFHRIVALAKSRILFFDRDVFDALLFAHPDLERMFLISVLDELDAARDWVLIFSSTSVLQRAAAFLVILARRCMESHTINQRGPIAVTLPVSRKHVADCLSVRQESLSRALHALAELGLVQIITPMIFQINDLAALVDVSNQDQLYANSVKHRHDFNAHAREL
ncbi:Crp/Fnr family transcriptional regulator [Roseinatronobacter sp.]